MARMGRGTKAVSARRRVPRFIILTRWAVFAVLLAGFAALALLAWRWTPGGDTPPRNLPPYHGARVTVDPGHGGIDGGTGRAGVLEKDINLAIGLEVHRILTENGIEATLTRDTDMDLGGLGSGSRWRRDLEASIRKTQEHNAQFMVSIHANASRKSSESGPLVFYPADSVEGRRLADAVLKSLRGLTEPNLNQPIAARFYVLRQSPVPTILVETGFLTNPEDRQKLVDSGYQRQLAEAIAAGVLLYLTPPPATP